MLTLWANKTPKTPKRGDICVLGVKHNNGCYDPRLKTQNLGCHGCLTVLIWADSEWAILSRESLELILGKSAYFEKQVEARSLLVAFIAAFKKMEQYEYSYFRLNKRLRVRIRSSRRNANVK